MKNVTLITVLAGAIGGVAATVVTKIVEEPVSASVETQTSLSPLTNDSTGDLEERVAQLQKENDSLAIRIASLESRPTSSREEIVAEGSQDVAELEQQILELSAALKNPSSAQSAGLRNIVANAMEEVRDQESAERDAERQQRDIDRVVERMDDYAEKLGLDAIQKKSMQDVLITETTKRTAMFNEMREGGMDRDTIRASMTTLGDETKAALGNILTQTQLETYNDISSDRGRFFGGGGDRGGRGGRGGGN